MNADTQILLTLAEKSMWLDWVYLAVLVVGVVKGGMKGFVLALFSFVGWFIGLAAALKLSSVVAAYLQQHTDWDGRWLPILSFILVFVIVVFLVRWAGKAVEGMLTIAQLGWLNRLGGALLYAGMYTLVFSILLFYIDKMQLVSRVSLDESRVFGATAGLAPVILENIGAVIPAAKEVFEQLEKFFEKTSDHISNQV